MDIQRLVNVRTYVFKLERAQYKDKLLQDVMERYPHSVLQHGYTVYSQNDEDGIIDHIFEKVGKPQPSFLELGVTPYENNTNALLLKGSKGVWIDKGLGSFKKAIGPKKRLKIVDQLIDLNNWPDVLSEVAEFLGTKSPDFVSIDIDGNDYYVLEKMLQLDINPDVLCLEYNAKFPPPIDVKIDYDPGHQWSDDDYYGASLQSFVNLLKDKYVLVCCNLNGVNAFFVKVEYANRFHLYTPKELYREPKFFLSPFYKGHNSSAKFINNIE